MEFISNIGLACKLDRKTELLAYLSVLASSSLESGIPFHVKEAKKEGATREEIVSSILVGLPAVGNCVIKSLPIALSAYDEK
ncbi:Carboxymuconolactone decarboxylase family protein [compost metagenome]